MKNPFPIMIIMLCMVIVLPLSPVPSFAQGDLGTMDLKGLTKQAEQLAKGLDKAPSNYDALRNLGIIR